MERIKVKEKVSWKLNTGQNFLHMHTYFLVTRLIVWRCQAFMKSFFELIPLMIKYVIFFLLCNLLLIPWIFYFAVLYELTRI